MSCVNPLPSTPIVKTSYAKFAHSSDTHWSRPAMFANAIRLPSGDQDGSVALKPVLGICVRPLPSAFITYRKLPQPHPETSVAAKTIRLPSGDQAGS